MNVDITDANMVFSQISSFTGSKFMQYALITIHCRMCVILLRLHTKVENLKLRSKQCHMFQQVYIPMSAKAARKHGIFRNDPLLASRFICDVYS